MIDFSNNVVRLDEMRLRKVRFPTTLGRREAREQRIFPRRKASDRLFVQIVESAGQPDLVGTTVSAMAVDMSASGICFTSHQPFPVGTIVDLWVDVHAHPGKFFLAGEVRAKRHPSQPQPLDLIGPQVGGWVAAIEERLRRQIDRRSAGGKKAR